VRQRPPAVAAHGAVPLVDGDQIGGERGQRVEGARGQRPVQPLVELGLVGPAVGDGGVQHVNDPITVRVGRAQRR
jgi:hypothetical protein